MSVTTSASSIPSRIDEQLRLRITEDLSGKFKGDIIGPDHADYEQARLVWNAMIDRRPGLILRCTSTQDVVAAVTVAREHGFAPAVRCGGHDITSKAMSDGGLTIDLSGLREFFVLTVDPVTASVSTYLATPSATSASRPRQWKASCHSGRGSPRPSSCPTRRTCACGCGVNGELQLDQSTAATACPVSELIVSACEVVTLATGDVIATGTPSLSTPPGPVPARRRCLPGQLRTHRHPA